MRTFLNMIQKKKTARAPGTPGLFLEKIIPGALLASWRLPFRPLSVFRGRALLAFLADAGCRLEAVVDAVGFVGEALVTGQIERARRDRDHEVFVEGPVLELASARGLEVVVLHFAGGGRRGELQTRGELD